MPGLVAWPRTALATFGSACTRPFGYAQDRLRRLAKLGPSGRVLRVIDGYKGEHFKGPNDLVIDQAGGVYFTDSGDFDDDWVTGRAAGAIYYLAPTGALRQVDAGLCFPNAKRYG